MSDEALLKHYSSVNKLSCSLAGCSLVGNFHLLGLPGDLRLGKFMAYRLTYTLLALWPIERMPEVGSWHSSRSSSEAVVRDSPVSLT